MTGVDREGIWVAKATERASANGLSQRFQYRLAAVESLPFDDGTFDLVTCQTLLMHVPDPQQVLGEMLRVTRPGGLVLAAEPTNVAGALVDSIVLEIRRTLPPFCSVFNCFASGASRRWAKATI